MSNVTLKPASVRNLITPKLPAQVAALTSPAAKKVLDAFDTNASYAARLRGMPTKDLEAEAAKLQRLIADASQGGDTNASVVARAREQLGEVRAELETRKSFNLLGPNRAYAGEAHRMSDSQLGTERQKQLERYREASTGLDKDPAKAKDAQAKLAIIDAEQQRRLHDEAQGKLPKTSSTKPMSPQQEIAFRQSLKTQPPAGLAKERIKAQRDYQDATTGPNKDPVAAANARKRMAACDAELKARGAQPLTPEQATAFQKGLENKSTKELQTIKQQLETRLGMPGLNPQERANLMRKIGIVDGTLASRQRELAGFRREVGNTSTDRLMTVARRLSQPPVTGREAERLQIVRDELHRRHDSKPELTLRPRLPQVRPPEVESPPRATPETPAPAPAPAAPAAAPAPVDPAAPAAPTEPAPQQQIDALMHHIQEQLERYTEATTGVHQDPAIAADALSQIKQDLEKLMGLLQGQAGSGIVETQYA